MMTFEEIAAKLSDLSYIPAPSGGYMGVKQDVALMAQLASAMIRLEYNMAYQLALMSTPVPDDLNMDNPELMKRYEASLQQRVDSNLLALRSEPQ